MSERRVPTARYGWAAKGSAGIDTAAECGSIARPRCAGAAYVLNAGDGTVTVVDTAPKVDAMTTGDTGDRIACGVVQRP